MDVSYLKKKPTNTRLVKFNSIDRVQLPIRSLYKSFLLRNLNNRHFTWPKQLPTIILRDFNDETLEKNIYTFLSNCHHFYTPPGCATPGNRVDVLANSSINPASNSRLQIISSNHSPSHHLLRLPIQSIA